MTTEQLKTNARITTQAIAKMRNGEVVTLDVLAKICSTVGCQLSDIVDIGGEIVPYTLIPNVNFELMEHCEQFEVLGFSNLYDLHIPITRKSVQDFLVTNYRSSTLSLDACNEVLRTLEEDGILIEFPQDIEPDIDKLPRKITGSTKSDDNGYSLSCQKIENYLNWYINKYARDMNSVHEASCKLTNGPLKQEKVILEKGILTAHINHENFYYTGNSQSKIGFFDSFPSNLICAIFQADHYYMFENKDSDIRRCLFELLDCCTSGEKLVLLLHYKYGLSGENLGDYFELPRWQSLIWGIDNFLKKSLQKIQHPRRHKKLSRLIYCTSALGENKIEKRYNRFTPYRLGTSSLPAYTDFLADVKKYIWDALNMGQPLEEILSTFYTESVVVEICQNIGMWFKLPEIPLEELGLSWVSYYALRNAQLGNSVEIWEKHGKDIPLSDCEESGLQHVIGLDSAQICEILDILSLYIRVPRTQECIASLVDYAETISVSDPNYDVASGMVYLGETYFYNINDDFIACTNYIDDKTMHELLKLKYRKWSSVMNDYQKGVLHEKLSLVEEKIACEYILKTINMVSVGEFPVKHYVFDYRWDAVLEANSCDALQDIREKYLFGLPIKYNFKEFELLVPTLFPSRSWAFRLLYNTRTGNMQWFKIQPLILKPILYRFTDSAVYTDICELYIGIVNDCTVSNEKFEIWFAIQMEGACSKIVCIKLSPNGQLENKSYFPEYCNEFGSAILFRSTINQLHDGKETSYEGIYVQAQLRICNFYRKDSDESVARFYSEYIPVSFSGDSSFLLLTTIDELDLSVRSFNCLKRANIHTVGDLIWLSGEDIMKIRNRGKKALDEITKKLEMLGLSIQW